MYQAFVYTPKSCELPKEVVLTEIYEPMSGCCLNSVSHVFATFDRVCISLVNRLALIRCNLSVIVLTNDYRFGKLKEQIIEYLVDDACK